MKISYDHSADVLYLTFSETAGPCEYVENDAGQILRIDPQTGHPVGCTIPLFMRRTESGDITVSEVAGAVSAKGK